MTTMTKSDRLTAIERILKETFEPRFDELKRLLTEAVNKNIAEQFPEFPVLYADPNTSRYLNVFRGESARNGADSYRSNHYLRPHYEEIAKTYLAMVPKSDEKCALYIKIDVRYNYNMSSIFTVPGLVSLHDEIWDDLIRAAGKLRETFFAYKSREAFAKDFPKLAAYLPTKVTTSSSTAVRLNPVDVMKDLASMGIPPETEEAAETTV